MTPTNSLFPKPVSIFSDVPLIVRYSKVRNKRVIFFYSYWGGTPGPPGLDEGPPGSLLSRLRISLFSVSSC